MLEGVELVEHASVAITGIRSANRSRFDDGDDIAIELMRDCSSAMLDHNGEHRLKPGDLYVVDYAQPMRLARSQHRACGVVLSRRRVVDLLGEDVTGLAGRRIEATGLAVVLRQHMMTTLDEAAQMTPAERILAVQGAAEMALAVLSNDRVDVGDARRFGDGFFRAACKLIERHCSDAALSPDRIALALGCSRASLYRVFDARGESVSAWIWQERLEKALRLLITGPGSDSPIADIAQRCGFRDQATLARMFRRRFGMTPSDARKRARPGS